MQSSQYHVWQNPSKPRNIWKAVRYWERLIQTTTENESVSVSRGDNHRNLETYGNLCGIERDYTNPNHTITRWWPEKGDDYATSSKERHRTWKDAWSIKVHKGIIPSVPIPKQRLAGMKSQSSKTIWKTKEKTRTIPKSTKHLLKIKGKSRLLGIVRIVFVGIIRRIVTRIV